MRKILVLISFSLLLFACKQVLDEPDAELLGRWTDTNTMYTFNDDMTYGTKYLRVGVVPNSVFNDSVYGEYVIDSKRNNITFNLKGYVTKAGISIDTSLNATTWNYSIENDTTLNYESNTTLGNLVRVP